VGGGWGWGVCQRLCWDSQQQPGGGRSAAVDGGAARSAGPPAAACLALAAGRLTLCRGRRALVAERAQQFQAAYHDAASKMEELIGSPGFAEEVGGGGAAPSRVGEAGGTAGGRRATVLAEGGQTGAMSGSTTHFTAGLGAACGPACRQLAVPGRGGQGRLPMPQLRPCSRQGSWSCRPQSVAQPLFLRMHSRQPCLPAPCLNNR
jgi:hypothetical protein